MLSPCGCVYKVAGVRSNLWPGAAAVAFAGAFTNVYVGWAVKTERFLPLPPPPVAQEYDQVLLAVSAEVTTCSASWQCKSWKGTGVCVIFFRLVTSSIVQSKT